MSRRASIRRGSNLLPVLTAEFGRYRVAAGDAWSIGGTALRLSHPTRCPTLHFGLCHVVAEETRHRLVAICCSAPCRVCFPPDRAAAAAAGGGALAGAREHAGVPLGPQRLRSPAGRAEAAARQRGARLGDHHSRHGADHRAPRAGAGARRPRPAAMAPSIESWRRAITPATRPILVAHLFGGRTEMGPVLELARQHGLLVIEDCAQAFAGMRYQGHPAGRRQHVQLRHDQEQHGLGRGRAPRAGRGPAGRMRAAQAAYPVQSRWPYLKRLAKYAVLKLLPAGRSPQRSCESAGRSAATMTDGSTARPAAFPATVSSGRSASSRVRRCWRCWSAVCGVRMPADGGSTRRKAGVWRSCLRKLRTAHGVCLLLWRTARSVCLLRWRRIRGEPHTYWVFPVLVEEPQRLMAVDTSRFRRHARAKPVRCRSAGGSGGREGRAAEELLKRIVFLPFYPELPMREARRMAR